MSCERSRDQELNHCPDVASAADLAEVAPGVRRLALPLGIHGVPTVSAYLLHDDDGDVLVDCGVAAGTDANPDASRDGTAALSAALDACGSSLDRLARLVDHARAHRPLRAGRRGGAAQRR